MAVSFARAVRTLRSAAWLDWKIEANWTDPFIFVIYSIAKPIASVLILVVMYLVIARADTSTPFFSYMYLGNTFYVYVAVVLFGIGMVVHDDREHYQTLRQLYIAPVSYYLYLIGRALTRVLQASGSVAIILAFGILILGVRVPLDGIDWPLLVASLILGLLTIVAIGVLLAGTTFLTAHHAFGISEGVAGMFYLFSGVIFPLTILPGWAQEFSRFLPLTYWFEALRRSLNPAGSASWPGLSDLSNLELLAALAVATALSFGLSLLVFWAVDHRARQKGKLDWTTTY